MQITIHYLPTPDATETVELTAPLTWQDRTRGEQLGHRMKLVLSESPHTNMSLWAWAVVQRLGRTPQGPDGAAVTPHTFLNYLLTDIELDREAEAEAAEVDPTQPGQF